MKQTIFLGIILLFISCTSQVQKSNFYEFSEIKKIEVVKGFPGEKVSMQQNFEGKLITDLNSHENIGPTKFMKSHRVLIYKQNGEIDTLRTNGEIFVGKNNTFKVKENLLDKYILKPFFDFNELIHYRIEIDENKLLEREEGDLTIIERLQNDLIIMDKPEVVSDTSFISQLEKIGFKKNIVTKTKFARINNIFSVKQPKESIAYSCIAVFRDILVFKKNNKVIGIAKICFSCDQNRIVGTKMETVNFGQDGDYSKLHKILNE